jgi:hypothetical protein
VFSHLFTSPPSRASSQGASSGSGGAASARAYDLGDSEDPSFAHTDAEDFRPLAPTAAWRSVTLLLQAVEIRACKDMQQYRARRRRLRPRFALTIRQMHAAGQDLQRRRAAAAPHPPRHSGHASVTCTPPCAPPSRAARSWRLSLPPPTSLRAAPPTAASASSRTSSPTLPTPSWCLSLCAAARGAHSPRAGAA